MNKIKKCNRCGEEYNDISIKFLILKSRIINYNINLCPKCMDSFNTWWHNGKIQKGEE